MKFESSARAIAALSMLAQLGCAGVPYVPPAGAPLATSDDLDTVTGSNMPRRRAGNGAPAVKQADKDALASEIRNQTRNSGQ